MISGWSICYPHSASWQVQEAARSLSARRHQSGGCLARQNQPDEEQGVLLKMQSPWPIPKSRPYHWGFLCCGSSKLETTHQSRCHPRRICTDITVDPYEKVDLSKAKSEVVVEMMQQIDHWKSTLPIAPSGNVFSSERSLPSVVQRVLNLITDSLSNLVITEVKLGDVNGDG